MQCDVSMSREGKKVVQTEIDQEDYENLLGLAQRKNMTIKEATREALKLWSASVADLSEDPLFKLKPVEFKVKVKSEKIEEYLYRRK